MIHRIVLFLKFAPVFGRLSIVPLWNRKKHKTSVDGQTFKSLWISTLLMSQISTIVDSSRKARGCPGLGRGFFIPIPTLLRPPPYFDNRRYVIRDRQERISNYRLPSDMIPMHYSGHHKRKNLVLHPKP